MSIIYQNNFSTLASGSSIPAEFTTTGPSFTVKPALFSGNALYNSASNALNGGALYNISLPSGNVSIQARFKSSSTVPDATYGGAALQVCNSNGFSGGTENGGYSFAIQQYNYAISKMPGYGSIFQCGP